jgi:predicted DsbA family dithiol-disulfide isomerase
MHDLLFARPKELDASAMHQRAAELGLDLTAFQNCQTVQRFQKVRSTVADAASLSVKGTPTFFLGEIVDGQLTVRHQLVGAVSSTGFLDLVGRLIAETSAQSGPK